MTEFISVLAAKKIVARAWGEKSHLQPTVMSAAHEMGWRVAHFHDSRREVVDKKTGNKKLVGDDAAKGFPDLVLLRGSRGLAVELKSEAGDVSNAQHEWLAAFALAGFETAVWRPSDWLRGDIERVLL